MKIRHLILTIFPLLVIVAFVIWSGNIIEKNRRTPSLYLIPEGVAYAEIHYDQEGYPELKKEDNYIVYNIPSNGILKTSTTEPEYGKASDKYFYVDGDGERVVISPENIRGTIGGEEGKPVIQTIIID